MVHASQQFTPQQLLEAGHRAEGEGKLDLAAQFYRHLAEHYSYTGEAAEARNGLGRVGATQSQIWQANGAGHAHGGAGNPDRRQTQCRADSTPASRCTTRPLSHGESSCRPRQWDGLA